MRSSMSSHKINNINGTLCLWQTDVDRLCDEVIIFGNAKTMYMFFIQKSKRGRLIVWRKWIGRRTFKFRRRKKKHYWKNNLVSKHQCAWVHFFFCLSDHIIWMTETKQQLWVGAWKSVLKYHFNILPRI